MPNLSDLTDNFSRLGPRNLWEAMGMLARIQDEQEQVIREGDMARLNRLLSEQAVAWSYVKAFALQLIERGEAPADLAERLRGVLQVHTRREEELEQAKRTLAVRLRRAQLAMEQETAAARAA